MSKQNNKAAVMNVKSSSIDQKLAEMDAQISTLTNQSQAFQNVANQAATKLLQIENLAAPFTLRKFNWVTALFNLKETIAMIKQIIALIKEFKDQFMTPQPVNNDIAQ